MSARSPPRMARSMPDSYCHQLRHSHAIGFPRQLRVTARFGSIRPRECHASIDGASRRHPAARLDRASAGNRAGKAQEVALKTRMRKLHDPIKAGEILTSPQLSISVSPCKVYRRPKLSRSPFCSSSGHRVQERLPKIALALGGVCDEVEIRGRCRTHGPGAGHRGGVCS